MFGVAIAFISSALWGTSDFIGGLAARRAQPLPAAFWSYVGAVIASGIAVLATGGVWSRAAVSGGSAAAFCSVVGFVVFYAALVSAPMGAVAVLVGVVEALVPALVGAVWHGETLTITGWAGIGLSILGAAIIGSAEGTGKDRLSLRTFVLAVSAGVTFGLSGVALDVAPPSSALIAPALEVAGGLVLIVPASLLVATSVRVARVAEKIGLAPGRSATPWNSRLTAVIGGVVLASANVTLMIALHIAPLAVVGVVVSLYPITTAVLARVVLGEILTARHLLGIALALLGCTILAAT